MAINDADQPESDGLDGGDESTGASDEAASDEPTSDSAVRVGEYTWREFMREHGFEEDVTALYRDVEEESSEDSSRMGLGTSEGTVKTVPDESDWRKVEFDPTSYLGVHPTDFAEYITADVAPNAKWVYEQFREYVDPETTPVVKGEWTWEHFKWQYYYDENGDRPRDADGDVEHFDETDYLSFEQSEVEGILSQGDDFAQELADVVEERTVNVQEEIEEDEFFSDPGGHTTVVNRYDLEKAVPMDKKTHFREEERYWVNKPYAFIIIFLSEKENERKYYVVQPYMNELEDDLEEFMTGKLRTAIKYSDENVAVEGDEDDRRDVIDRETKRLLKRYDLFEGRPATSSTAGAASGTRSIVESIQRFFGTADPDAVDAGDGSGDDAASPGTASPGTESQDAPTTPGDDGAGAEADGGAATAEPDGGLAAAGESGTEGGYGRELDGIKARPEPVLLEEDPETLNEYQVEKLLYFLKRDFIGYERIDPIKHDINVEDISCDGYNSPIFVYHSEYEQIITNIYHGKRELDDFVVKLAQRSGKGISKRRPQVDATLPDGSRAQLTLGEEVSDHGTNYTIRQFKDVPFTPIDLINWNTFSLDEMAFLWLCIENHKSLIFAGGTASGKTTSLNAISLFIPSNTKIVSIEDTREVELPQRNWVASVTRPSFSEDSQGDVDEFDLLRAALRQRPDYIVMGEIRGEEGRTLFQVMSTGHTTYTTFHADSVGEVLKRFTTDPINVSKTMFTALDLVSIQTQTRVGGHKVRRNRNITEINHYDAENDEINVQDVYQWQAETDEFLKMGESNTLDEIKFDRGWGQEKLDDELFKRRAILAYLIKKDLNQYAQVAATVQAFINDPDTILTLIANGQLEESLQDLRDMESVLIDVDPADEELVPRPEPDDETYNLAQDILERAEESMFEEYRGQVPSGLASALSGVEAEEEDVDPTDAMEERADEFDFGSSLDDVDEDDGFVLGGSDDDGEEDDFSFGGEDEAGPSWLSDDGGGFSFGEDGGDDPFSEGGDPFAGESEDEAAATAETGEATANASADTPQLEAGDGAAGETVPQEASASADAAADADAASPTAEDADGGSASPDAEVDDLTGTDEATGDDGAEASDASEARDETASARSVGDEEPGPVFEDQDAGDIDAEFPSLTEEETDSIGESTDARSGSSEAADADGSDSAGDVGDADGADASEGAIFGEDAGSADPDSVFDEVETDGDDEEEDSFFGDDDEPFFDEDDQESIFGDADGSVFDDGDEDVFDDGNEGVFDDGDDGGSVFESGGEDESAGGETSEGDESDGESVFGSGGDGVFGAGGDDASESGTDPAGADATTRNDDDEADDADSGDKNSADADTGEGDSDGGDSDGGDGFEGTAFGGEDE